MSDTVSSLELARKVLRIEAAAILGLVDRINGDFVKRPGSSSPLPSDSLPNESAPESIGP